MYTHKYNIFVAKGIFLVPSEVVKSGKRMNPLTFLEVPASKLMEC